MKYSSRAGLFFLVFSFNYHHYYHYFLACVVHVVNEIIPIKTTQSTQHVEESILFVLKFIENEEYIESKTYSKKITQKNTHTQIHIQQNRTNK